MKSSSNQKIERIYQIRSSFLLEEKRDAPLCFVVVVFRVANELSLSELGLVQTLLMKIRVESSRAREMIRAKKSSSNSAHYYLS
jgi:hypothetical protein